VNVVAFGAHPDDLEIGMGGTVARHASAGDRVVMVVSTIPNNRDTRRREAERAADVLGAELMMLDIPPDELVHGRTVVKKLDKVLGAVNPEVVYTHWNSDSHQDHNAVAMATIAAARKNTFALLMYEQTIPGGVVPGGFKAQSFVDISDYIERKCQSILVHQTQIEQNGGDWWLDGVRGRAMYRGYQINVRHAEAFEVVKMIAVRFRHDTARTAVKQNGAGTHDEATASDRA
jgi:LmbE family N-acetylglucosaminyl deacetylase